MAEGHAGYGVLTSIKQPQEMKGAQASLCGLGLPDSAPPCKENKAFMGNGRESKKSSEFGLCGDLIAELS